MKPLIGVGMVGMGAVMVFGGITGRLAPMLAALFVPSALTDQPSESFWSKVFGSPAHDLLPFIPDIPGVPFISYEQPAAPAPWPTTQPAPQVNPYVLPGAKVVTT